MRREFLMGNEAMALGALASGLDLAAGYPGTPSTEVLETIAKRRTDKHMKTLSLRNLGTRIIFAS